MGFDNLTDVCNSYNFSITCETTQFFGINVLSPEILPLCMLAAFIGYTAGSAILKLQQNTTGRIAYAITFFAYGVMMSDAAFNDCFLSVNGNQNDVFHLVFGVIDAGLTSSIGASFIFLGLIDVGVIGQSSKFTITAMFLTYLAIFAAWICAVVIQWQAAWLILYGGIVALGGGVYLITESIFLFRRGSTTGLGWVLVAGLSGFFGLIAVMVPSIDSLLCHKFGCHFAGDFVWFVLSDVAVWALYKYYIATHADQAKPEAFVDHMPHVQYIPLSWTPSIQN